MNIFKNIFSNKGVLGINARNILYLKPFNPKKAIKLADDKIKTKQFLSTRGIPVPKLYYVIRSRKDLNKFKFNSLPQSFVLKPNKGYGGEGILPIIGKIGNKFVTSSGKEYTKSKIKKQIIDILDGRYSIGNTPDYAFFEQIIISDDSIGKFSYKGLPDIRIVVHNLVPVMAMLRLPTKESEGKANLHMGAVGVGIDISKGQATYINYKNKIINEIPNKGEIKGLKIPFWDEILLIASRIQLITNLGYLAADICIDKNLGPVLLEINARAGLGVQIANLAPLQARLEKIKNIQVTNPTKGVRVAKDLFGNVVEKEVKQITGKTVIRPTETLGIMVKNEKIKITSQIDTTIKKSKIQKSFAEKIGLFKDEKNYDKENERVKVKFSLKGKRIQTYMDIIENDENEFEVILGRRDLSEFLIDPFMKVQSEKFIPKALIGEDYTEVNYEKIDRTLYEIDNKAKLVNYIKPINIEKKKHRYFDNPELKIHFKYKKLKFNPEEEIERLNKIKFDDSIMGRIFKEKKEEIELKIELINNIGKEKFTEYSKKLFGMPSSNEIEEAKTLLLRKKEEIQPDKPSMYKSIEFKEILEKKLNEYEIFDWKIVRKNNMISSASTNKKKIILIKKTKYSREKIEKLIIHELETHLLTSENGIQQPYKIFKYGFPGYLSVQEGLAIYNIEKKLYIPFSENTKIASLIVAMSMEDKTFFEIIDILINKYGLNRLNAFGTAIKVKRGVGDTDAKGIFTKEYSYYKGYNEIKDFVDNGGDIKDLYIGKINIKHLEEIKNLPLILKPKYLPHWLNK